jgi:alanine-alpha-ketoisovalerate/valine-pyruvate aminotransferase
MLIISSVVTKNPADFIGNVIGQSEANTKAILANTVGKVLIIDEAVSIPLSTSFRFSKNYVRFNMLDVRDTCDISYTSSQFSTTSF